MTKRKEKPTKEKLVQLNFYFRKLPPQQQFVTACIGAEIGEHAQEIWARMMRQEAEEEPTVPGDPK